MPEQTPSDAYRAQVEAAAKLAVTIDSDPHMTWCLRIDAAALMTSDNQVRYWSLYEVDGQPGQWRHPESGSTDSLAECLRGIACVYLDRIETQEPTRPAAINWDARCACGHRREAHDDDGCLHLADDKPSLRSLLVCDCAAFTEAAETAEEASDG